MRAKPVAYSIILIRFLPILVSNALFAQSLSTLTLAQAKEKQVGLKAKIDQLSKSASSRPAKDMFESTADFNAREKIWRDEQEDRLIPLRSHLIELNNAYYIDAAVKPEFVFVSCDKSKRFP